MGPRRLQTMESEYTSDASYKGIRNYKQSFDNANVIDTMAINENGEKNNDNGNHKRTVSEIILSDQVIEDDDAEFDDVVITKGGPQDNDNNEMMNFNQNMQDGGGGGGEGFGEEQDIDDIENEYDEDEDDDVLSNSLVTKGQIGGNDNEEIFAYKKSDIDLAIHEDDEIVISGDEDDDYDDDQVTAGNNQ